MTIPSFKILEMDVIRRMNTEDYLKCYPLSPQIYQDNMYLELGYRFRQLIEAAEDHHIDLCDALNHAIGGTKT